MKKILFIIINCFIFINISHAENTTNNNFKPPSNMCYISKTYGSNIIDNIYDDKTGVVAYKTYNDGYWQFVFNGELGEKYELIRDMELFDGGKQYVYKGIKITHQYVDTYGNDRSSGKMVLVVNGNEIQEYDYYLDFIYSEKSGKYAYVGVKDGLRYIVNNGIKINKGFKTIGMIAFDDLGENILSIGTLYEGDLKAIQEIGSSSINNEIYPNNDLVTFQEMDLYDDTFDFKQAYTFSNRNIDYTKNIFVNGKNINDYNKNLNIYIKKPDNLFYECKLGGWYNWNYNKKKFIRQEPCYLNTKFVDGFNLAYYDNKLVYFFSGGTLIGSTVFAPINSPYDFQPQPPNIIGSFGDGLNSYYVLYYYRSKSMTDPDGMSYTTPDISNEFLGINSKLYDFSGSIKYVRPIGKKEIELLVSSTDSLNKYVCDVSKYDYGESLYDDIYII